MPSPMRKVVSVLFLYVNFNFIDVRDPFLKTPGNLTGPKSNFQVSRKLGCVLTSYEVHFVSLAENFTVQFSKLLKPSYGMENKTA